MGVGDRELDGGNGGNIHINADYIFRSPDSVIEATSERGINGQINISAPDTDVIGVLSPLPANVFDATALLPAACAARLGVTAGGLTEAGHAGALPADPEQPLVLPYRGDRPADLTAAPGGGEGSPAGFLLTATQPAGAARLRFACGRQ